MRSIRNFNALAFAEMCVLEGEEDKRLEGERARMDAWVKKNGKTFTLEAKVVNAAKPGNSSAQNAAEKVTDDVELTLFGIVGWSWYGEGITAVMVRRVLDQHRDAKSIRVLLDTPGGDYFDGVAIMNLFRRHNAKITIEVMGEATSAGSVIAMGGDTVEMRVGTMMMIHRAWSCMCGNGDEMRSSADLLDQVDSSLVDIYAARTGKDKKYLKKLVDATTWMNAEDAVKDGFADTALKIDAKPSDPKADPEPDPKDEPPMPGMDDPEAKNTPPAPALTAKKLLPQALGAI